MDQLLAMRAFVRVVEATSFSRAADQLGLPRSTASKLVSDLEKHLGAKLLHRTTRTVAASPEGMEYYQHASRLIAEVDRADAAVRGRRLKPRGHLRVDAPAAFANCLLIPALPRFHRACPEVTVAMGISDRTVNLVGEGVDCVIRGGQLPGTAIVARKVTELEYVTCASRSYLQRAGTPASPAELRDRHMHVAYFFATTGKPEPMVFDDGTERHEFAGTGHFSANDGNGFIEMMRMGLGIGQVLKAFVRPLLDSGELVALLPGWRRPALPIHVIYPPNRHQTARLKVFVDWLLEEFKPAGAHWQGGGAQ